MTTQPEYKLKHTLSSKAGSTLSLGGEPILNPSAVNKKDSLERSYSDLVSIKKSFYLLSSAVSPRGVLAPYTNLTGITFKERKSYKEYKEKFDYYINLNFIELLDSSSNFMYLMDQVIKDIKNGGGPIISSQVSPSKPVLDLIDTLDRGISAITTSYNLDLSGVQGDLPPPDILAYGGAKRYYSRVTFFHIKMMKKSSFMNKSFKFADSISKKIKSKPNFGGLICMYYLIKLSKEYLDGISTMIKVVYGQSGRLKSEKVKGGLGKSKILKVNGIFLSGGKNWLKKNKKRIIFDHKKNTRGDDGVLEIETDSAFYNDIDDTRGEKKLTDDFMAAFGKYIKVGSGGQGYGFRSIHLSHPTVRVQKSSTDKFILRFDFNELSAFSGTGGQFYDDVRDYTNYLEVLIFEHPNGDPIDINGNKGNIIYANNEDRPLIKNSSGAVTQPLYSTIEDGEEVIFTASDLVRNMGKVKLKSGKYIKPTKWRPKGLSAIVRKWKPGK